MPPFLPGRESSVLSQYSSLCRLASDYDDSELESLAARWISIRVLDYRGRSTRLSGGGLVFPEARDRDPVARHGRLTQARGHATRSHREADVCEHRRVRRHVAVENDDVSLVADSDRTAALRAEEPARGGGRQRGEDIAPLHTGSRHETILIGRIGVNGTDVRTEENRATAGVK